MNNKFFCACIAALLLIGSNANATITLPKILGHNMVLQSRQPVPLWGFASQGEQVTVSFNGQLKKTTTDASGHWKVLLDPLSVSAIPAELSISGSNSIVLQNILVGEVWLCSGQSNMEYTMRKNSKAIKPDSTDKNSPVDELDRARNPEIRIFLVTSKNLQKPDSTHSGWAIARDSALRSFSAAAYFFAKELHKKLHVPVGMISSAIPGSAIEPWLSGTITSNKINKPLQLDEKVPGKFFPTMVKPLAPFAIKGFLWYQGETNCFQNETIEYTYKMQALIEGWRKLWNDKSNRLSFYYVQIAPYYYSKTVGKYPLTKETLPKFWEAQKLAMQLPNTGMAVINDLGVSPEDLHPRGKWGVGRRLAQWALAKNYKQPLSPSGPLYKSKVVKGDKIELQFDYTGAGLISSDGKPLDSFTIAAADGKFVPANAIIEGNKVLVSSATISHPVHVRFAWSEDASPNFFNKDGLPAVPFRTDNPLRL